MVQTYSAMAQWAQDNKFIDSGLKDWALVNLGYNYHKFKDDLNETLETNGKRLSVREVLLLCGLVSFTYNCR